ncbi:FTR1 family iron permease [Xanthobacter tagetidis]|uniref:Iron permease n=1 Tax=Xanthobacter tagetidis TaxID=60216 RepID=A0A3L7APF0_9HYPH|nr:FTR1 family protein [Xanthobacter tagetidis]MBB6308245.1 high-affinity iron transporter [Xanthobacter tagetidis]RLP81855.1 iron permease [Xanthobacter tagetidis]
MLAALLIVFREVLEAGLVVGVVLAATEGIRGRGLFITGGLVAGVLGSALLALFADQISGLFEGSGQDVLNAAILSVAVVMLVWTVVWMASHGREMVAEMKAVGRDVKEGRKPLAALAVVVGMAVLREGVEIVLFMYGIVATGAETAQDVALGAGLGLAGGALVSFVLYRGLVAIPLKHLFKVTTILITLLAAGLSAQVVGILQDAGFIQSLADPVWNSAWLLADDSAVGRVLRTLVGYRAEPTGMQLIAYAVTVGVIVALSALVNGRIARTRPRAAQPAQPEPAGTARA